MPPLAETGSSFSGAISIAYLRLWYLHSCFIYGERRKQGTEMKETPKKKTIDDDMMTNPTTSIEPKRSIK